MDTDTETDTIHPENIVSNLKSYERNGVYIKSYLARKYNSDSEWREKVNKQRAINQRTKYQTDPVYREGVLQKRKQQYITKQLEKQMAFMMK